MSQHNTPQNKEVSRMAFELRPELWDARYNDKERETLKAVALQYGLDPLTREVMVLKGNIYVTASGLQKLAVRDPDYDGCEIEVIQADWDKNFFVVKARIWKKDCAHPFEDFGDADPSTSSLRGHALFRHAITRARARAMRSAFAIPFCALEELDDEVRWRKAQRNNQSKQGNQHRRPRQWVDKNDQAQLELPSVPANEQVEETVVTVQPAPKAAAKAAPKKSSNSAPKTAPKGELIDLATPEQQQQILEYAEKLDMTPETLADDLMQQYGVPSWEQLSNMQAQLLLELLKDRLQQHLLDKQNVEEVQNAEENEEKEEEQENTQEEVESKPLPLLKKAQPTRTRAVRDNRRMVPKPSRLEQVRIADECVRKMEDADSLQILRDEWEDFQSVRHLLSAELIDRICKTKNERKLTLSDMAA